MEQILLIGGTSFLITFFIFPIFISYLNGRGFGIEPGGRKVHKDNAPAMGGIPIFIGVCITLFIWLPFGILKDVKYIIGALLVMLIIGLRDDLKSLSASLKLFGQIAAALVIIILCDIRLTSLYGIFGVGELDTVVSYLISLFTIIVVTNAFNLIDGIDGLSSSIAIIILGVFGLWFFLNDEMSFALMSFAFAGTLLAFLNFNWFPSKVIMGDTGSLLIGFFLSIITIKFIDLNHSLKGNQYAFDSSVGTAIALLIFPLADTARVFVKRIAKGKSPFKPDKKHFHHVLLRIFNNNHAKVTSTLIAVNITFVSLVFLLRDYPEQTVLPSVLALAFVFGTIIDVFFKFHIKKIKGTRN